jgi:hypothetical protein
MEYKLYRKKKLGIDIVSLMGGERIKVGGFNKHNHSSSPT